ncbi:ABC-three component system protein [Neobacillus soli]|uniref:ABC-three component system protein n=1 Tax=Neobacillus soli TaxID=220688 RepID=UPI000826DF8E|nr:ABC-three component system protein [Neobacillus soli]
MNPISFITEKDKENLIIFVHGFTGDKSTWTNSDGKSFPEMLKEENEICKNFDIAYFDYFTKLVDLRKTRLSTSFVGNLFGQSIKAKKNIGINKLGEFFKAAIDIYCSDYKNIIIVAHSMGGLVSKAYILNELKEYSNTKVKLFISLAVPHNGSNWAHIGKALFKKNPQIIDLKPLSELLKILNDEWIQIKVEKPKTIYYYGNFDDIVKEESAISYQVEKQFKIPCDEDHLSISKPTKDSLVYQGVKKNLIEFITDLNFKKKMSSKSFEDDGKLDDEVFVLKLLIADVHNRTIKSAKETFFNAEYMKKALISKGYNLEDLRELYTKIEHLYGIFFNKLVEGEIKNSNQLVNKIYEQIIEKDMNYLKTTIPFLDAIKKTGMLHQLANNLDKDIWWEQNHSIKNIEDFRRARDKYGE